MSIEQKRDIIIQGDCLEILKTIPDESVDLVFADPPYNMQTEGELLRTDGSTFNGVTDKWDKFVSLRSCLKMDKKELYGRQKKLYK